MNRQELADRIASKRGSTVASAKRDITVVLESILEGLAKDGRVAIESFAVFEVVERAPRKGRNPLTNEPVDIPAKEKIRVRVSPNAMTEVRVIRSVNSKKTNLTALLSEDAS